MHSPALLAAVEGDVKLAQASRVLTLGGDVNETFGRHRNGRRVREEFLLVKLVQIGGHGLRS